MKVFNFFAQTFAIFAFLTLGSLLIIFGVHIIELSDILDRIKDIYLNPLKSFQTIAIGIVFISIGLAFAKTLLKKGHQDAIIFQSEIGPIVISLQAIEDVTKKILKKFHLVKESKLHTTINQKDVHIKIKLVLWSGGKTQELLTEIQEESKARLRKLLGPQSKIEVTCDVSKIEDHEVDLPEPAFEIQQQAAV